MRVARGWQAQVRGFFFACVVFGWLVFVSLVFVSLVFVSLMFMVLMVDEIDTAESESVLDDNAEELLRCRFSCLLVTLWLFVRDDDADDDADASTSPARLAPTNSFIQPCSSVKTKSSASTLCFRSRRAGMTGSALVV